MLGRARASTVSDRCVLHRRSIGTNRVSGIPSRSAVKRDVHLLAQRLQVGKAAGYRSVDWRGAR
jgi:hypothetical protein